MKFKLSSPLASGYLSDDYPKNIIGLYPFLEDMNISIVGYDLVIEINTLEELNNLVEGCKCHVVYDATNNVDDGLNGKITIYDDYLE